ncbi:MAG: VWA domain-containing protein [Clostridia bacterium]|nr:VWA domain-containing protein [Clostridia bacterium]
MKKNNSARLALIALIVFALVAGVVALTQNWGKKKDTVTTEAALKTLDNLYAKLTVNKLPLRQNPDFIFGDENASHIAVLPDISEYPFRVNPVTDHFLTIYASVEISDWLADMAMRFNQSGALAGSDPVSVSIRSIPSGLAADFISSGKYTPDLYIPSGEIYGDMLIGQGVDARLTEKRLAGNASGILIAKKKSAELNQGGTLHNGAIIDAVLKGSLALGYTSPLTNEDGFNFILALLSHFDSVNPLSDTAIESLRRFQDRIPLIAYDNDQLKASLTGGTLDAVVLNYQAYSSAPNLTASYDFVPIGYRQDNPLYKVGGLTDTKNRIADQFIAFCLSDDAQKAAADRGFNHTGEDTGLKAMSGADIYKAQEIYKKEKNGSSDLTVVFVADISGSMEGSPLLNLKASLNRVIGIINPNVNVGFVTFSDVVNIAVPIAKFDNNQKSYFSGAVKSLFAGGGTAMFDAVVVAQKMLMDAKARNPNTKLMIFVLTDGETNRGYSFNDIESMSGGLRIPIYTIGYNANIDILQKLSGINEAATINADSDNVIYRLESLFNAQM